MLRREDRADDGRLTQEEVAAVARLHAERLAEIQAREQAERERLAETSAPEEVASLLGATPEEVRALADEVRRRGLASAVENPRQDSEDTYWDVYEQGHGKTRAQTKPNGTVGPLFGLLALVVLFGIITAIRSTPPTYAPPTYTPPTYAVGRGTPPIWDPYTKNYRRSELAPGFGDGRVTPVLDSSVATPPAGYALEVVTPDGTLLASGPPAPKKALDPKLARAALRRSVASLLVYVEGLATAAGEIPYLTFPTQVSWTDVSTPEAAATQTATRLLGWHSVRVTNPRGSFRILVPDIRFVRPGDEAAFKKEREERLDWLLDNKTISGAASSMRRDGAKLVTLGTAFPKGVALCVMWNGGKLLAEGKGDRRHPGRDVEAALVELLGRAYDAGGSKDPAMRAVADVPLESVDVSLSPYEWGREAGPRPPLVRASAPKATLRLFGEAAERAFAPPVRRRAVLTFADGGRSATYRHSTSFSESTDVILPSPDSVAR